MTIRDRGGHYILTVKGNQPNLRTCVGPGNPIPLDSSVAFNVRVS